MKQLTLLVIGLLLIGITNVYGGGVTDDNNGNKGYIFISTGENHGANSVGHWTDVKDVPELKGEKGDKGDTGEQGIQGEKGDIGLQGIQGIQGENGLDGINGVDGQDGENGLNGADGKDVNPETVNELKNTDTILDNKITNNIIDLQNQKSRINDLDNRVNELEETQYIIEGEARVIDTKKWTVKPFVRYSTNRAKFDTVGVRFTFKFGKSYEERKIEELEQKLLQNNI